MIDLFFPTAFLFFLHFKMGQVQPLLHQSASVMLNLTHSPLWQAYVLGRNLERPIKTPSPLDNLTETAHKEETTSIVDEEKSEQNDDDDDDDSDNKDDEEEDDSNDEEDSDEYDED